MTAAGPECGRDAQKHNVILLRQRREWKQTATKLQVSDFLQLARDELFGSLIGFEDGRGLILFAVVVTSLICGVEHYVPQRTIARLRRDSVTG